MAEIWRLFIAIRLPPTIVDEIREIQEQLKQQTPSQTVKWVDPQSIHLTLKFLGDVPLVKRGSIQKALTQAAAGHSAFKLTVGGLGCFPNANRPRVVWVGIHQSHQDLTALHASIESHIAPLGYPTENRPFSPHLTLGRVRREAAAQDIRALGETVAAASAPQFPLWTIQEVILIRSELNRAGAIYTDLFPVRLSSS